MNKCRYCESIFEYKKALAKKDGRYVAYFCPICKKLLAEFVEEDR